MPSTLTYPGVYIEELPSGVHTIVGVSTAETAFVDFFARGPVDEAVRITSFSDFERRFGGLNSHSEASYAIMQYFLNGGQVAWVVRETAGASAAAASATLNDTQSAPALKVDAVNPGKWGESLQITVDYETYPKNNVTFNLVIQEVATVRGQSQVVNSEVHRNLSTEPDSPRYAVTEVNHASELVRLTKEGGTPSLLRPAVVSARALTAGNDGDVPPDGNWQTSGPVALKAGLDALDTTSFNILCLPAAAVLDANGMSTVLAAAIQKCQNQRAFFLIDVPRDATQATVPTLATALRSSGSAHAALYFPRLTIPDPLNGYKPRNVGPSGTLAGLYARIDASRGVWKAPAGTEAVLNGVTLAEPLTDAQNGALNPLGINVLRALPVFGTVCWGARTLDGADVMTSDFKYIPVRRLTSYIETSLYESTKWAVFEPNAEPLWAQLRLSIGTFMADLQKQGAFYRYVVRCDETTTTPSDIARGVVNIVVAFAPVKPAEFVVLQIQQLAGQSAA